MEWKDIDWSVLKRLRERFLEPSPGDYWKSDVELDHYDLAFAPRIEAKWNAVLRETSSRLKEEGPLHLLDWGCGTATASSAIIAHLGKQVRHVSLWDQSPLARSFALKKIQALGIEASVLSSPDALPSSYWLVASHVWNELRGTSQSTFLNVLGNAQGFIWVEPGTPALAGAIVEARSMLRSNFEIIAPCTHQAACGMLAPENSEHWCHHFAEPDSKFFQTAEWNRFSKEMQIDLRSLPTSFLVGSRHRTPPQQVQTRVIGRARISKVFTKVLGCNEAGVEEKTWRADKKDKKVFGTTAFTRFLKN